MSILSDTCTLFEIKYIFDIFLDCAEPSCSVPYYNLLHPDQSDEEDTPIQKDEAWNPKIKMSNLGPKMDRPVRDSVKNIAIEKGLSHAAHKRGSFVKIKASSGPGKIHKKPRPTQPQSSPSVSSLKDLDFSKDRNRAKKVGNTAKQRLGKILGLKF